jgi:hypothetical protein
VVVVVVGAGGLVVDVVEDASGRVVDELDAGVAACVETVVEGPLMAAAAVNGQPASNATAPVAPARTAVRQLPVRYNPIGLEHGIRQPRV